MGFILLDDTLYNIDHIVKIERSNKNKAKIYIKGDSTIKYVITSESFDEVFLKIKDSNLLN